VLGIVLSVRAVAPDLGVVQVRPPPGVMKSFALPGQYHQLSIGERQTTLALASAPAQHPFEYLVRAQGDAARTLLGAEPGAEVTLGPLQGDGFNVSHAQAPRLLLVCTGTGFAPLRSLLLWLEVHRTSLEGVTVLWGLHDEGQAAFASDRARWSARGVTFALTLSAPSGGWQGLRGRVQTHWREWLTPKTAIYACGQREMVESLRTEAAAVGSGPVVLNV
jgi:NAD(P)H-flavin reductase